MCYRCHFHRIDKRSGLRILIDNATFLMSCSPKAEGTTKKRPYVWHREKLRFTPLKRHWSDCYYFIAESWGGAGGGAGRNARAG